MKKVHNLYNKTIIFILAITLIGVTTTLQGCGNTKSSEVQELEKEAAELREKLDESKKRWDNIIESTAQPNDSLAVTDDYDTESNEEDLSDVEEPEPTTTPKPKKTPKPVPIGCQNALDKAEDYLDFMAFSKKGLIKQLKYEGYTTKEAKYAVNHVSVSWKEQAAKKAQNYMDTMSFSKSRLIDQLKYEGFTEKQARYGAKKVGY